jgi:hypothetical protein
MNSKNSNMRLLALVTSLILLGNLLRAQSYPGISQVMNEKPIRILKKSEPNDSIINKVESIAHCDVCWFCNEKFNPVSIRIAREMESCILVSYIYNSKGYQQHLIVLDKKLNVLEHYEVFPMAFSFRRLKKRIVNQNYRVFLDNE